jgi:hypothetical protein
MQLPLPKHATVSAAVAAALRAGLVVWALLAIAAVFVMTLGTDEAWVLNGLRSVLHLQVEHLSTELIVTSGGPFALLNVMLEWAAGSKVWLHRLVSLVCLALAFAVVLGHRSKVGTPAAARWAMLAPLVAVPGAAEVGTAALGTSMGLFLMLAALAVWASRRTAWVWRVAGGGLLYGLAAASRFDLVLVGPAVLIASSVRLSGERRIALRLNLGAWAFVAIGVTLFLLNQWLMSLPANAMAGTEVSASTGLDPWSLNYPKQLNQWFTLTTLAPLAWLAVMTISAFWWPVPTTPTAAGRATNPPRFETLLGVTGAVLLAAWLVRAPIPHLRYAFPALFCFAALGAFGLRELLVRALASSSARHVLLCHCVALAFVLGSIGSLTRSLVMADSDYASWEWTHEMPFDYFRRFEARQHQLQAAAFLRDQLPADARLYSYVPYALRYLTNRPVVAIDRAPAVDAAVSHTERYLVLTPAIGTYFSMKPESAMWILSQAPLVKQIGRYSIYRLPAGTDADLSQLKPSRSSYDGHPGSAAWFGRR